MARLSSTFDTSEAGTWDDRPAATFGEIFRQNVEDAHRVSNQSAMAWNTIEAYDRVSDQVKSATGKQLINPLRYGGTITDTGEVDRTDPMEVWRNDLATIRAAHPDALPWDEIATAPERMAYARMRETREATNRLNEQTGMTAASAGALGGVPVLGSMVNFAANAARNPKAAAAQLLGGLAGQITSPLDVAGNLVGFNPVGAAAKSLIKNAAYNALSNAGVQAVLSATKQGEYAKAGLPYGWKVWLEEVEGAAATGGAIDLAIRGPARAAIRRFGTDTPADTPFSRNTPRGGLIFDAIEATPTQTRRAPVVEITPEQRAKIEAGDLATTREVLERTGAIEDPAARFALEHLEGGGRFTEEGVRALEAMGVARGDQMMILSEAMRRANEMPEPMRAPAEPLAPEMGATLAGRLGDSLSAMPADIADAVRDGLDAGIPDIVRAIAQALETPSENLSEKLSAELDPRMMAEARIHGGRAGPVEIAQALRQFPEINTPDLPDSGRLDMARSLARMDPVAFEAVARGDVPPEVGAMVASRVPREAQARVLSDLAEAAPRNMVEVSDWIDSLSPAKGPDTGVPLDGGAGLKEPAGAEVAAKVEALRREAGPAYEDAMAPMMRRDQIESELETLKGQAAKLEEGSKDKLASFRDDTGLDMSPEARKARAEAMGFDTSKVWYHGTDATFDAFDLSHFGKTDWGFRGTGVYMTPDKTLARRYGQNVGAYHVRGPIANGDDASVSAIRSEAWARSVADSKKIGVKADDIGQRAKDAANQALQESGFTGYFDATGDELVIFDPSNIRSVNADFDPAKAGSANLMASIRDDADNTTAKLAEVRAQIREKEAELAQAQLDANPTEEGRTMLRLAERAMALKRQADIRAAITEALELGYRMTPAGTEIKVRPDEEMIYRAASGESYQLDATSDRSTGDIQLALHAMDPTAKLGHEALHTLVTRGLVSPDEIKQIAAMAREAGTFKDEVKYRDAYSKRADFDRIIEEEAAASYIEARIKGEVTGPENTTIERIRQFIERLRNALAGYGFQSREDIVRAMLSGDMARREARAEWGRNAVRDMPEGQQLFALRDGNEPPIKADMVAVDRMNRIAELMEACRA